METIMRLKDLEMATARFWRRKGKREGVYRGRGRERKKREAGGRTRTGKVGREEGGEEGNERLNLALESTGFQHSSQQQQLLPASRRQLKMYKAGAECGKVQHQDVFVQVPLISLKTMPGHTWLSAGWRISSVESGSCS